MDTQARTPASEVVVWVPTPEVAADRSIAEQQAAVESALDAAMALRDWASVAFSAPGQHAG